MDISVINVNFGQKLDFYCETRKKGWNTEIKLNYSQHTVICTSGTPKNKEQGNFPYVPLN